MNMIAFTFAIKSHKAQADFWERKRKIIKALQDLEEKRLAEEQERRKLEERKIEEKKRTNQLEKIHILLEI
jgi:hypothetical protein